MLTPAQLESRNIPNPLSGWLCQDDKTTPDRLDPAQRPRRIRLRLCSPNKPHLHLDSPFLTDPLALERRDTDHGEVVFYKRTFVSRGLLPAPGGEGPAGTYKLHWIEEGGVWGSGSFCGFSKVTQPRVDATPLVWARASGCCGRAQCWAAWGCLRLRGSGGLKETLGVKYLHRAVRMAALDTILIFYLRHEPLLFSGTLPNVLCPVPRAPPSLQKGPLPDTTLSCEGHFLSPALVSEI